MPDPLFEFFEVVAGELSTTTPKVITNEDISEQDSPLLDWLMKELKAVGAEEIIPYAVERLRDHFQSKGAVLPFQYEPKTGVFTTVDSSFLSFVDEMRNIRSIGKRSRDFECGVAERLALRVTGAIHRVGHPRDLKKKRDDFNDHLKTLGFDRPVLLGSEKDGGLDILWQLPIGATPHRPFVLVQCKNGEFDLDAALVSIGVASSSLAQHGGLQNVVHVPCVLFNDYLHPNMFKAKQLGFVPLGLSDLALSNQGVSVELI